MYSVDSDPGRWWLGKTVKPKAAPQRFGRKSVYLLNFLLLLIPVTYFGYQPLLRYSASAIIIDSQPEKADAAVLLAGGDPGRIWGAADVYSAKLAPVVVLTREGLSADDIELQRRGINIYTSFDKSVSILRGLGVPQEAILHVDPYVQDTFDELTRVRQMAEQKGWKSLIIVTSNFHTRRANLVARYILGSDFKFTVVSSAHGGLNRDAWWTSRADIRTFLIEFQKLVAYTLYIWPRLIL